MQRLRRRPAPEQHIQPNQQIHHRNQPRALVRAPVSRLKINLDRVRTPNLRALGPRKRANDRVHRRVVVDAIV